MTLTEFFVHNTQLQREWAADKNTRSPDDLATHSRAKVWWRCEKGHEWEALVSSVAVEGCGCPYCSGNLAIPGETDLMTLRPDLMEQWDFEKNTLDPRTVTVSSHEKVWWKDSLGHSWKAMVFSRTKEKASGCPYCTGRLVLPGFNDMGTLRPKLAEQWYQPLNGDLKPSDVTLGSNKKAWWECADGHVWEALIYARTKANGTGCPVCAGMVKQRKGNVVEFRQYKKRTIPHKRAEAAPVGING